jgi:hypothetical protein
MRMGHHNGFASSVGYPRSDSIGLLVYDGMRQYPWHRYCILGPSEQHKTYQEWVKGLNRPYEVEL